MLNHYLIPLPAINKSSELIIMVRIQKFIFNLFQVNTYILYDETGECVIIDPGCVDEGEQAILAKYIEDQKLSPVKALFTHTHVDHIMGSQFITDRFKLKPMLHKDGLPFLERYTETALSYGVEAGKNPEYGEFIKDGDIIKFGNSRLKVLYTPGHADGSVCFVNDDDRFVLVGDVLFKQSIGRTDFPTGDFDILQKSIREKLYTLPDDYTVYPGHMSETSIGFEKSNNPFISE